MSNSLLGPLGVLAVLASVRVSGAEPPIPGVILGVHGGTGVSKKEMTPELDKLLRADLTKALEAGYAALQDWAPPALLCYNDLQAVGALRACRERGRRVPEEVSLMGFDDIELASYVDPPLTTFAQPGYELGSQAADMLLALLEGAEVAGPVMLPGRLVVRGSVRHH